MIIPDIDNRLNHYLKIGVNLFSRLKLRDDAGLNPYISEEVIRLKEVFSKELPSGYANSRTLYRSAGIDPTKYRPSSEALFRRVKKGKDFPNVNSIVNITNLLSLKFQIPFGLYNCDSIVGDVVVRAGEKNEFYRGIRKDRVSLENKIVLCDDFGPFGNPSSDSLRTSVDPVAENIMQILFFLKNDKSIDKIMEETSRIISDFFLYDNLKTEFF